MGYIRGESRSQMYLLPGTIDDYIAEENPAHFLDAFVKQLDLEPLGFVRATAAACSSYLTLTLSRRRSRSAGAPDCVKTSHSGTFDVATY